MNKTLEYRICQKSITQTAALLDDHFAHIVEAMQQEVVNGAKRYSVSLSVILEPIGNECIVKSKISYSTKRADETEPDLVSDQPELGLGNE